MGPDDYDTVEGWSEGRIDLKGSRFIGIVMPCPSEECIPGNLSDAARKYPDATHYCWASIHSGPQRKERSSDNGEPSGTAGKPISGVLRGTGLSDVMCIVVRYFGGTLLGTGGLVHAYTQASRLAVDGAARRTCTACDVYSFTLDYPNYDAFSTKCRDLMARRPECEYTDRVRIKAWVRTSDSDEFEHRITDLTRRCVRLDRCGREYL